MHIPDGMLSTGVVAATSATSLGFIGYAVAWLRRVGQQRIVLMAVMAALIFALQMLNFPVAGGTSGHFAGGAAAAIMLGPWPAVIVLTTVLMVQALIFADGGILALGANVLNLAVISPFLGYAVFRAMRRISSSPAAMAFAAFTAAWIAVFVSALAAGVQIWLSGRASLLVVGGAMGFWHALIGIGEGLITAGLVTYVYAKRPDLVLGEQRADQGGTRDVAIGLGIAALGAAALSFLASSSPDGLEFVYFEQGVGRTFEEMQLIGGLIPDYVMPGVANEALATVLAGIVGVIITGALLWSLFSAGRKRREGDIGEQA
jgi:cobalt/nickel transport system permease protein